MDNKKEFSYEEIRSLALSHNITDNAVNIGMWARFQGYQKRVVQRNNKRIVIYTNNNSLCK